MNGRQPTASIRLAARRTGIFPNGPNEHSGVENKKKGPIDIGPFIN